jgi:hypothetical protein
LKSSCTQFSYIERARDKIYLYNVILSSGENRPKRKPIIGPTPERHLRCDERDTVDRGESAAVCAVIKAHTGLPHGQGARGLE